MLVLDLVEKRLMTDQLVLTVGYDIDNLTNPEIAKAYRGAVTTDRYGRKMPKHAHGTVNLKGASSSSKVILEAVMDLFDRIVNPKLLVRRIYVTANHVADEKTVSMKMRHVKLNKRQNRNGWPENANCRRHHWPSRRNLAKMLF